MADNKEVKKGNRDIYLARLKERYPDKEYDDDEALFGQINEDYDNYDNDLSEMRNREQSLADLFAKDERSTGFLMDWRNGEDPVVNLIRKFGSEMIEHMTDPEVQEKIAEANKEYLARVAKNKEYEDLYKQNMDDTIATIDALKEQDGLTDEEIDSAIAFLTAIIKDGITGKFTSGSIKMALNALNHDADVAEAGEAGETRGRNAKIEEKLRKRGRGDGTANLAGSNGGRTSKLREDLGALNKYGDDYKSVWD